MKIYYYFSFKILGILLDNHFTQIILSGSSPTSDTSLFLYIYSETSDISETSETSDISEKDVGSINIDVSFVICKGICLEFCKQK